MTGVEQMDLLDAQRSIVLARSRRRPEPVGGRAAVTGRGLGAASGALSPESQSSLSRRRCGRSVLAACSAVSVPEIALDLANPKQPSVVVAGLSRRDLAALERAHLSARGLGGGVPRLGRAERRQAELRRRRRALRRHGRDRALHARLFRSTPAAPTTSPSIPRPLPAAGLTQIPEASRRVEMPAAPRDAADHASPLSTRPGRWSRPTCSGCTSSSRVRWASAPGRTTSRSWTRQGADMPGALLPLDTDLWNGEHTRFTFLFDPGRVKRGILPESRDGPSAAARRHVHDRRPPRVAGRAGPAARLGVPQGLPRRPADRDARCRSTTWSVAAPAAGSREPLRLTFPSPLDHGLVQRALTVAAR